MNIRGFWSMILATVIWGNFVLIFAYLGEIAPLDIVAHRVFWGGMAFVGYIAFKGRMHEVRAIFARPRALGLIAVGALLVMSNWLAFVWAVGNGRALDAGFGYFIYPLISVALGVAFKGERPSALQIIAIALAAIAVLILSLGLGRLPLITLVLAATFALYGFVKSYVQAGAVLSVTIENILLYPFAVIWLAFIADHQAGFFIDFGHGYWLIMSGLLTAITLIGFSYATKTLSFAFVGMLFFINPTLQVVNAALILVEPMSLWHKIAFPIIWLAVGLYSYDLWQRAHRLPRPVKMP